MGRLPRFFESIQAQFPEETKRYRSGKKLTKAQYAELLRYTQGYWRGFGEPEDTPPYIVLCVYYSGRIDEFLREHAA